MHGYFSTVKKYSIRSKQILFIDQQALPEPVCTEYPGLNPGFGVSASCDVITLCDRSRSNLILFLLDIWSEQRATTGLEWAHSQDNRPNGLDRLEESKFNDVSGGETSIMQFIQLCVWPGSFFVPCFGPGQEAIRFKSNT